MMGAPTGASFGREEMSRITRPPMAKKIEYPTTDGKPMAETELRMRLMMALIQTLEAFFRANPMVYVWGNLLVFYERGNKRKHLSPDVFVVRGVPGRRHHPRDNYLIWEEGMARVRHRGDLAQHAP
jgi:hypothetical protein